MTALNTPKKRNRYFLVYFYMILILLLLLSVATYTWFSISTTPRVSDLSIHITTLQGLELATSIDADTWEQQLDFVEIVDETAPLRPVTWSEKSQQFFAACYGFDGRLLDVWEPLTDQRNANKDNADGYYTKITLYGRTGQNVTAELSPAVEVLNGTKGAGTYLIGTPIWDEEGILHNNGGVGAEYAVRIGFRITKLALDGTPAEESPVFFIYEPNADRHLDGTEGYIATPSIDETDHLIDEKNMIIQTASTWTETDPVQRDVLIHDLGDFTTDTKLFYLTPEELVQIDIYIWLEGQDVDCTNQISQAQLLANIQFSTSASGQSGMVPIEDE